MDPPRRISLVTLMGLPASGKTTLCQELIKLISSLNEVPDSASTPSVCLLQFDAVVPHHVQSLFPEHPNLAKILRTNFLKMLTQYVLLLQEGKSAKELSSLEDDLLLETDAELLSNKELLTKAAFVQAFINQTNITVQPSTAIDSNNSKIDHIFLIDDNNYYKSMRNDFYQIAKTNSLGFCILYPKTPLALCQERNLQRTEDQRIPSSVIIDMAKKLEEPNPMQNAADALCLQITDVLDASTHRLIYDTIIYTLKNPVEVPRTNCEEIARERRICAESEVHQADLILRKWIHTELALASFSSKRPELRSKGQMLQAKKSKVLEGLRSGDLQVASSPGDEFEFRKEVLALARQVKLDS